MRIFIVRNILVRFLLHFEWVALPIGAGGSLGSIINIPTIFDGLPLYRAAALAVWSCFIILLVIGLWRPVHRRLQLRRGDLVVAPQDGRS